jgi:hypothetical protein
MTLLDALRHWWSSGRTYDATDPRAGVGSLLRSPKVLAAAEDLPKINRCPECATSFVQRRGELCHRCAPAVVTMAKPRRRRA